MIISLCLQLIDYINNRLCDETLLKREENSLKLVKGVICDFVISEVQKRKECINVANRAESCINYDFNNC